MNIVFSTPVRQMEVAAMKNVLRLLIAIGSMICGGAAYAGVIYKSAVTVNTAVFSDPNAGQLIAEDFTLKPGSNSITGVRWTGVYASQGPTAPDNFTIELFADIVGAPAMTPFISLFIGDPGRTDTGIDVFSDDLFAYAVTMAPIILPSNTTYWISIVNDTAGDLFGSWAWGSQLFDFGGGIAIRASDYLPWSPNSAFAQDLMISGPTAIPEPATLVFLAIGFYVLLGHRRLYGN